MLRCSHAIPAPVIHLMIYRHQFPVTLQTLFYRIPVIIRAKCSKLCQILIHPCQKMHPGQIQCSCRRVIDERHKRRFVFRRMFLHPRIHTLRFRKYPFNLLQCILRFSSMHRVIHHCTHCLRSSLLYQSGISLQNVRNLFLYFLRKASKLLPRPLSGILCGLIDGTTSPTSKIICHIQKIRQWELLRCNIPHIDNPKFPHPEFICRCHLFPDFRKVRTVDPFIGNGPAVIVQMIVHPISALMRPHLLCRQCPEVSIVVITQQ